MIWPLLRQHIAFTIALRNHDSSVNNPPVRSNPIS
jgi:hypothetical protein